MYTVYRYTKTSNIQFIKKGEGVTNWEKVEQINKVKNKGWEVATEPEHVQWFNNNKYILIKN